MYISKKDGLAWFEFFAALPEEEGLMPRQQEIAYAVLAQIERAVSARRNQMMQDIRDALDEGRFTEFYKEKVELSGSRY